MTSSNIGSHTPGPWQAATAGSSVVGIPVVGIPVVGPKGRAIASLHFIALPRVPEEEAARSAYNAEQLANARLIAAAPDLLRALRALLEIDEADDSPGNIWDFARAAVDKAEGKQ